MSTRVFQSGVFQSGVFQTQYGSVTAAGTLPSLGGEAEGVLPTPGELFALTGDGEGAAVVIARDAHPAFDSAAFESVSFEMEEREAVQAFLPSLTASATGVSFTFNGEAVGTLPALTGDAVGDSMSGSIVGTLPAITGSAEGFQAPFADVDATLPALTGDASGAYVVQNIEFQFVVGFEAGAFESVAFETDDIPGVLGTLPSLFGLGSDFIIGTSDATLPALTGDADGYSLVVGDADGTLPALTGDAEGTATGEAITGTAAGTLPALTGDADGLVQAQGDAAGILPQLTGDASGAVASEVTGDAAGQLPRLTGDADGTTPIRRPTRVRGGPGIRKGHLRVVGTGEGELPGLYGEASGDYKMFDDDELEELLELIMAA